MVDFCFEVPEPRNDGSPTRTLTESNVNENEKVTVSGLRFSGTWLNSTSQHTRTVIGKQRKSAIFFINHHPLTSQVKIIVAIPAVVVVVVNFVVLVIITAFSSIALSPYLPPP